MDNKSEQLAWLLPSRAREKEEGKEEQEEEGKECFLCVSPPAVLLVLMSLWKRGGKGEERSRIFLAAGAKKSF